MNGQHENDVFIDLCTLCMSNEWRMHICIVDMCSSSFR